MAMSYYIDNGGTGNCRIWFKDTILANGVNIYQIEKVSGFSPVAGTTMFPDLFDDFANSSISSTLWNVYYGTSGGSVVEGTAGVTLTATSSYARLLGKTLFTKAKTLEYVFSIGRETSALNSRNRFNSAFLASGDNGIFDYNQYYYGTGYVSPTVQLTKDTKYRYIERWSPSDFARIQLYDNGNGTKLIDNNFTPPSGVTSFGAVATVGDYSVYTQNGLMTLYNVFAREYANIEPTITVFEQSDRYIVAVYNQINKTLKNFQIGVFAVQLGGNIATNESLRITPIDIQRSNEIWKNCTFYMDMSDLRNIMDNTVVATNNACTFGSGRTAANTTYKAIFNGAHSNPSQIVLPAGTWDISGDFTLFIIYNNPVANDDATSYWCGVMNESTADGKGFDTGFGSSGNPYFGIDPGASGYYNSSSGTNRSGMVYVGCVRTGSTQNLYVNGAKDASSRGTSNADLTHTTPIYIGTSNTRAYPIKGGIDVVMFWNRALSDAEMKYLYDYFSVRNLYPVDKLNQPGY